MHEERNDTMTNSAHSDHLHLALLRYKPAASSQTMFIEASSSSANCRINDEHIHSKSIGLIKIGQSKYPIPTPNVTATESVCSNGLLEMLSEANATKVVSMDAPIA